MKLSIKINPDNKPATLEDLKYYRDQMYDYPITTDWGMVDADQSSLDSMENIVKNFYAIPIVKNNNIDWTLSDNSTVSVTKDELSSMHSQAAGKKAVRNTLIHQSYNKFKAQSPYPILRDIKNLNYWLG